MQNRYERHRDIFDAQGVSLAIVGVGAVGRQAAIQAAAIGCGSIQLIDFDIVGDENLAAQGYKEFDLGLPKVEAMERELRAINSQIKIECINDQYEVGQITADVVFACVDTMPCRTALFTNEAPRCGLFVDARMSAELCRILTVTRAHSASMDRYKQTLFTQEEMHADRCTSKSTIYCASITGALMISELTKYLRGLDGPTDYTFYIPVVEIVKQRVKV